jgi:NAD(P)-dependent dehydrogenase (short-subunit alcohol dehydrogenase family)
MPITSTDAQPFETVGEKLKGRVAMVTGGTRGIGAAIAERLESDGWKVARLSRTSGDVQADVSDPEQVQAAFEDVRERFGPILVLVNNAGVRHDGLTIRMPADEWQAVVDTNLSGAFHCTRRALDDMLKARWGRIVNVSSVVAERANPGQANYVAAKAGLLGFTRTVAREMARKGVTSNAVTPGVIETDMTADLDGGLVEAVPAGRVGQPEDVAAAVAFLVSEEASYVNGATLSVDGALGA